MRTSILMLVLFSFGWVPAVADVTHLSDEFDDGSLRTNSKGIGNGWYYSAGPGAYTRETNGVLSIPTGAEHSVGLVNSVEKDDFRFWTNAGATITWVIKSTAVLTPYDASTAMGIDTEWRFHYLAYNWVLGVISGRAYHNRWNSYEENNKGGFYVIINRKNQSDSAECWISATNKNVVNEENPAGRVGITHFPFMAKYPIVITAKLTNTSWAVTMNQDIGSQKLSGNWTTDLIIDGIDASITNEFDSTAFIYAQGGNSMLMPTFPANTGELEKVSVVLHGVTAPAIRPFPHSTGKMGRINGVFFTVLGQAIPSTSAARPATQIILRRQGQNPAQKDLVLQN